MVWTIMDLYGMDYNGFIHQLKPKSYIIQPYNGIVRESRP